MTEISYWFRAVPDQKHFPTFTGNEQADVVIIGGGVAGLAAAYFLGQAGIKVILLEMNNVATGDSGFTTAIATRFLDLIETSAAVWEASVQSIELLEKIITKERIDCGWQKVDSIGFTQNTDIAAQKKFKQNVKFLQTKDPSIEYLTKKSATAAVGITAEAAYRKKGADAQFHSRQFLIALAERAARNGIKIFENSEVIDIKPGATITIKTATGTIKTKQLIVATGIPLPEFFPKIAEKMTTAITYIIDVKFSHNQTLPRAVFWDDSKPFHYFRSVNDNELLLGGEDWLIANKKPTTDPHANLKKWLADQYQNIDFEIINKWQGTIFTTTNNLPVADSHPSYGNNITFLTGWDGNGMTLGFLAGNIAADKIQQKNNPYQKFFSINNL